MKKFSFRKLFGKQRKTTNIDPTLYRWKYMDIEELDKLPDAIHDIYIKKYDGLIIRNVFNAEEVKLMRKHIEAMDTDKMIPTNEGAGHAFPRVFGQVVRPDSKEEVTTEYLQEYFEECSRLRTTISTLLGIDFIARLEKVMSQIAGGREIEVPKGIDGQGRYAATTIRMSHPGKGYINVHSGNYFQQEFEDFYTHLRTEVNVKDQLSYFVTVNPAQIGGELTLFDLIWEDGQTKEDANKDFEVILSDGTFLDTSKNSPLKRMQVKPDAGDLLIFSGGPIWHKVELVEGNEERIVIAGFLSFTKDKKIIKYWS